MIVGGKAFPVARSSYLSLLEFTNNWHAPRLRFVDGRWQLVGLHEGIDIAAEPGSPVLALEPGSVENVGWTFYSGTRVGVRGGDGRYYLYAHLSAIAPGVVPAARVPAGGYLGRVGNTGYGPPGARDHFPAHLHFGMEGPGGWENPYPLLVSLHRSMVEEQDRARMALDGLAIKGKREAWAKMAGGLFTDFGIASGE